jgi:two-component SAPR family response regulator
MVEWVRKKAMYLFIYKVKEVKLPIKNHIEIENTD